MFSLLYLILQEHAVILDAARRGVKTDGLTMYRTWVACNDCAKSIIDSGVVKVIGHQKTFDASPDHWKEPIKIARQMFMEAGVVYELWDGDMGVKVLFNGKPFSP